MPEAKQAHVKVFCDSQVAIQCIKKQGSTRSLPCNMATRNLLLHCEKQDIFLTLTHLGTKENSEADFESRNFRNHDTEWSLCPDIFQKICQIFDIVPQIDMFAERLNAKLPNYCSWMLDPHAQFIDAFTVQWEQFEVIYCFPSFSIIHQVLTKFQDTTTPLRMILVVPAWHTQSWYTRVMNLLIHQPIVIKLDQKTLKLEHKPNQVHPMVNRLHLLASFLSNIHTENKGFQDRWPEYYAKPEQGPPMNSTRPISQGGTHIVAKNRLIPVIHL